jgi:site-specific recombinase XerD
MAARDDLVSEPDPAECLIEEFRGYLIRDRALAEVTVQGRCSDVRLFLSACFGTGCVGVARLSVNDVQDFVLHYARDRAPKSTQSMLTTLRSFLRFLYLRGLIAEELADHVPSVACWRQTSPPKWLPDEDVERVLNGCDRHSAIGQRDYAVLLLLARLGLRAGEVRLLELDDIRWEAAEISVRGKGPRRKRFPLPGDVGEAMAAYLKNARPRCDSRRVFLRAIAPCRGLGSSTVGTIVATALRRAGLNPPMKGAYLFRHSLATHMLGKGATLTEIGQILHHANPDTTSIYAKVDIAGLRGLAMPWPGDHP